MIWLLTLKPQIFEGETSKQSDTCTAYNLFMIRGKVRINRWKNRALKRLAPFSDLDEQQAAIFTSCLIELVNRWEWYLTGDNICFEYGVRYVRCFCYVLSGSQPEIGMFV